ncbi:ATP synthase F0 subunit A [Streptococcus pneumoniae]|nr:ATP synthase F0 subunit A [Streptococcus pneumoniae]
MEESINPIISIGPVIFNLTMLAMTLLIVGVIFVFIYWASRNMTLKPKGKQNVLEYVYDFVIGFTEPNIGSRYMKDYSLFFLCLFLFMVIANNLGLMTKLQTIDGTNIVRLKITGPIEMITLSFLVILLTHIESVRRRGFKKSIKSFMSPVFVIPMNILEEFTNFLSLALRIFGNIFAGEVMTSLLLLLSHQAIYWYPVAFGANLAWTAFSVFISCIQAYVFTLLTSVYLGNKINIEEE